MSLLATAIVGLGPALVPIGAATVGAFGALGGVLLAAAGGVAAFGAIAKPTFTQVWQSASKLNELQQRYNAAVTDKQRQQILTQEQKLWMGLPSYMVPAVNAANNFQNALQNVQQAMMPQISHLMALGFTAVQTALGSLQPMISASGNGLITLAHDLNHALTGPWFAQFSSWMASQAKPAIIALGRATGNVFKGIVSFFMAFTPLMKPAENALVRMTGAFAKWAQHLPQSQGFQHFLEYLKQALPAVGGFLKQVVRVFAELGPVLASQGLATLRFATALLSALNAAMRFSPALTSVLGLLITTGVILTKIVGPIVTVVSWFTKIGTVIGFLSTAFEVLGAIIGAIVGVVSLPVIAIVAAVAAIVAAGYFLVTNWKAVEGFLVGVWHGIEAAAVFVFNAIKTVILTIVRAMVTVWTTEWHIIEAVALAIWNGLKAAAAAVFGALKFIFENFTPLGLIISHWQQISGFLSGVWNAIKSAASTAWSAITGAITTPINAVLNWFAGIWNWFVNAGENIVKGLISGVGAMAGWLIHAVENLASSALSAIGKIFGIGSPSRVMHGYGMNLIEGLVNGINSAAPAAVSAALRASGAMLRAFGAGTPSASFALTGTPRFAGAGIAASGAGGGSTVIVNFNGGQHVRSEQDIRSIEIATIRAGQQITRAQGRRGG